MSENYTAWMIELYEPPEMPGSRGLVGWWRGAVGDEDVMSCWTRDPNAAIKFLTEADAERAALVWGIYSVGLHRVTEHIWMDSRPGDVP